MIKAINMDKLLPQIKESINKMIDACNCTVDDLEMVLPNCFYMDNPIIKSKEIKTCYGIKIIYGNLDKDVAFIVRQKLIYGRYGYINDFDEQAKKNVKEKKDDVSKT